MSAPVTDRTDTRCPSPGLDVAIVSDEEENIPPRPPRSRRFRPPEDLSAVPEKLNLVSELTNRIKDPRPAQSYIRGQFLHDPNSHQNSMPPSVPRPGPARLKRNAGLDQWLEAAKNCKYLSEPHMNELCEKVKELLMEGLYSS